MKSNHFTHTHIQTLTAQKLCPRNAHLDRSNEVAEHFSAGTESGCVSLLGKSWGVRLEGCRKSHHQYAARGIAMCTGKMLWNIYLLLDESRIIPGVFLLWARRAYVSGSLEARIARMVEQRFSLTGSSGQPLEAVHTRSAHSWNIVVKGLPTFLCLNIFKIVFKTRKFCEILQNVSNLIIFYSGLILQIFDSTKKSTP